MKKRNPYIVAIASLLALQPALAQKQTPPPGGTAKDFKLSAKKVQTYANGLKSVTVPYGQLPKANISLIVKTGNVHEGTDKIWLSDLTARLLREGTPSLNFAALSKKAAMMGGNLNITVGPTQTTIAGSVLSEYAADFIKLIADLVSNPAFPASELDRLKSDFKRRLATQKAVPQAQAQEQFLGALYKDHPYGKIFPTEEMISSYTIDMVKDFYNSNFGAKRSVLYVVGKFDEKAVNAAIATSMTKWKAGPDVSYPPVNVVAVKDTLVVDRKGAPQTTIMVGLPVVTPTNKDRRYIVEWTVKTVS